jgi:formylglycine-generating enzyme required for sulfatase activity
MTSAKNQQVQQMILSLTIRATLCLILMAKTAPAAEQIDQSNLPEWAGGWTHVNPTGEGQAVMWQTFRPACTNVIAVEIDILTNNPGQGDDVLTVEIAKDGDVLASAECSVADGFDGLLRFEFPEAVPLVPEQTYELKVRDTGKTRFGWKYGPNTYERGSRYVFAQERPSSDWLFQTYSNIEPAHAKYSGGMGVPDDPYQIATAEDLMRLGDSPEDYDKHFILTADIDLDPNLPGRKIFDKAVISTDVNDANWWFDGTSFTGVFNGNSHVIRNLTIRAGKKLHIGLFGSVDFEGSVFDMTLDNVLIEAENASYIGSLVGESLGSITRCHASGRVSGGQQTYYLGGLIGLMEYGTVSYCHTNMEVAGYSYVGGLIGQVFQGRVVNNYSCGDVFSEPKSWFIGGLVGGCFVSSIMKCYSIGTLSTGQGSGQVGGLVGRSDLSDIHSSFWNVETSGVSESSGGTGKTTSEMQTASTFLEAGWDFVGETLNGPNDIWKMWDGYDYPRLAWEPGPNTPLVFVDINDPGFYGQMSKYEVTNAQYCDFLNAALASGDITVGSAQNPRWHGYYVIGASGSNPGTDYAGELYYNGDGSGWSGLDGVTNGGAARIFYSTGAFYVDSGFGNHPVTEVSWYGTMAFANYYGYYLPTEEQWQGVADYDDTYLYGCGTSIDNSKANCRGSTHPFGITAVGSFGQYGYGMSDMAGNVWEWTSTSSGNLRVIRGGCWFSSDSECTVSLEQACLPLWTDGSIGFRVCR